MRRRRVAGAIGLGSIVLIVVAGATPATADRLAADRMAARDVAVDCEQATRSTPPGGNGALELTTDVPEGAVVGPGAKIGVRLTWDPEAWSGEELDMALACVEVKGGLNPAMSAMERPAANDGVFEYRLVVPENIKPDCDICVEGFLAGTSADGAPRIVGSDARCFMSGPPGPPTPPATEPPAPPATGPPTTEPPRPPASAPPKTTTTVADVPPAEAAGGAAERLESAPAPAAELPRTGPAAIGLVAASGGLTLIAGGLGVIGGTGRRVRRRTAGSRHRPAGG